MKCLTCKDADRVTAAHEGVEVDYCPACQDVGMDWGQWNKLLGLVFTTAPARAGGPERPSRGPAPDRDRPRRFPGNPFLSPPGLAW